MKREFQLGQLTPNDFVPTISDDDMEASNNRKRKRHTDNFNPKSNKPIPKVHKRADVSGSFLEYCSWKHGGYNPQDDTEVELGALASDCEFQTERGDDGVIESFPRWNVIELAKKSQCKSDSATGSNTSESIRGVQKDIEPMNVGCLFNFENVEAQKVPRCAPSSEVNFKDGGDDNEERMAKEEQKQMNNPSYNVTQGLANMEDIQPHRVEGESDSGDNENYDHDEVAAPNPHPYDDILGMLSDDEQDNSAEAIEYAARQKTFFASADVVDEKHPPLTSSGTFQAMKLSRPILKGIAAVGFTVPTPIQLKTIPLAMEGRDIVGGAATGSGKTAAFLVPILERLLYRPKKVAITRVGILMPTRELALQCFDVAKKLAAFTDISFALTVGGLSLREQEQTLKQRPDVVIATPGRFIDHMRNSASFAVENLEILVLDEADRMLEDGFADELNEILSSIPKSKQTMLFSATMTEDVDKLIRIGLNRPVRIIINGQRQTVGELIQEFIKIPGDKWQLDENKRLAYLVYLCVQTYVSRTIVFFPRKSHAHRVRLLFSLFGVKAAELHGSMSQEQRLDALSSFRSGRCTHLLATDVASRGLDIAGVETVINFTVPTTPTTYLHRVGRTARAGRAGVACTLFSSDRSKHSLTSKRTGLASSERTLLRPLVRMAKKQGAIIRQRTLPSSAINEFTQRIVSFQPKLDTLLLREKEERLLHQSERDVARGENLVRYRDDIAARPRRTWFQSEKNKKAASRRGMSVRLALIDGNAGAGLNKQKQVASKKKNYQVELGDQSTGRRTSSTRN